MLRVGVLGRPWATLRRPQRAAPPRADAYGLELAVELEARSCSAVPMRGLPMAASTRERALSLAVLHPGEDLHDATRNPPPEDAAPIQGRARDLRAATMKKAALQLSLSISAVSRGRTR